MTFFVHMIIMIIRKSTNTQDLYRWIILKNHKNIFLEIKSKMRKDNKRQNKNKKQLCRYVLMLIEAYVLS